MMKVQSFGCQPLKPSYQMSSKPAFGNYEQEYRYDDMDVVELEQQKAEMEELARNKDSKFLSTVGTLGVGFAAGALSFITFKTMAPKGFNAVKSLYNKVASIGFVKKSAKFVKEKAVKLGGKIATAYKNIKPESRLGKIKKFVTEKATWVKTKMAPVTKKLKSWGVAIKEKLGINKASLKEGAKNTGATLVAIPAAVTAVNSDLKAKEDDSYDY